MRCREAFEFQKLAYDPESATLYHRERIENEGKVALDAVVGERRYTPVEMLEMLRGVGFVDTSFFSVRAGRWDFSLPFDPIAPEILYLAKRPEALLIIHRDSRALVGD